MLIRVNEFFKSDFRDMMQRVYSVESMQLDLARFNGSGELEVCIGTIFHVTNKNLADLAVELSKKDIFIKNNFFKPVCIKHNEIWHTVRIHPATKRRYVEHLVREMDDVTVYVDGELVLEKKVQSIMDWKI